MVDMNKLVVAFKDTKNKGPFNALLLAMFNELGGAEAGAVDLIVNEFEKAGIVCKRKSIIGKLGVMGIKTIVKPKARKTEKKDEGPTKKELISSFISLLGITIDMVDTINNMRKADIKALHSAVINLLPIDLND